MTRRDLIAAAVAIVAAPLHAKRPEGADLIGKPAPPLALGKWINSRPLELTELRGKVVLIRWWTQGCPFCQATAPALNGFQQKYGGRGFQVIGIYHPKPAGNWDMDPVVRGAEEKRFAFPVALDGDWTALKRWWLTEDRDWTSVSFLLDKQGVVRYIHPGGEFHEGNQGGLDKHEACNREFHAIDSMIAELIGA